jgi:serine/threonine protein kinase
MELLIDERTVRSKHNLRFYAIKVINKQHVVRQKQVEHTNNELHMLETVQHPFIINLWGSFQDPSNLYMVMDFVPGGELFTLLRRSNVTSRNPSSSATKVKPSCSASLILLRSSMLQRSLLH